MLLELFVSVSLNGLRYNDLILVVGLIKLVGKHIGRTAKAEHSDGFKCL